jgi:predicted transcriptional regulator
MTAQPLPTTDLFDIEDEAAKEAALAEAEAELDAGHGIPLADVARWLKSWGKPDELPPPPWK